jgi:hypothetical protein
MLKRVHARGPSQVTFDPTFPGLQGVEAEIPRMTSLPGSTVLLEGSIVNR